MKRRYRLTRSTDFQQVRRNGKSYAHPLLVLAVFVRSDATALAPCRFGISARRSLGTAVQRNRVRRRLRAALHSRLPAVRNGCDVVLIARKPLMEAGFTELQAALDQLLRRANLLSAGQIDLDQPVNPDGNPRE